MKKINVDKMIESARNALGWPYKSPGSNDHNGIDCSGLLVKCFRDQGGYIYHGSNTIYRNYCSSTGRIDSTTKLEKGMAVFKWKAQDTAKYPDGRGDFCHVGLVASVDPLKIIHASSVHGCVYTDTKIGNWLYWGKLKDVIYPDGTTMSAFEPVQDDSHIPAEPELLDDDEDETYDDTPMAKVATVYAANGKPVKMRAAPSKNEKLYEELPVGTKVTLDKYGAEWCQISYGKRKGWYMMTKFLSFDVEGAVG